MIARYLLLFTLLYSSISLAANIGQKNTAKRELKQQTLLLNNTNPGSSIAIVYPQIINNNSSSNQLFNQKIKNFVATLQHSEIKHSTLTDTEKVDYQVIYNKNNLISIRFKIINSPAGAAHPSITFKSFNYDFSRNQALELSDLFPANSNYLQIIANHCHKILMNKTKKNPTKYFSTLINAGTKPITANYQIWSFGNGFIRITFNPGQVAADLFHGVSIKVPLSLFPASVENDKLNQLKNASQK